MSRLKGHVQSYGLGWQMFKTPVLSSGADIAIAVDSHVLSHFHTQNLDNTEVGLGLKDWLNIGAFGKIRVIMLGQGADTNSFSLNLYGMTTGGIINRIGSYTCVLGTAMSKGLSDTNGGGFHAHPDAGELIRLHMGPNRSWVFCDTYTELTDLEGICTPVEDAGSVGWLTIDFSETGYEWLLPLITGFTIATEACGVFRGVTRRNGVLQSI